MKKEELEKVIIELQELWNIDGTDEDIEFILNQVTRKIKKG